MKNFRSNSPYKRRDDRDDRQMHHATCADCGKSCEVPFRPSGDKPVYCSNCFKRDDSPKRDYSRGREDRGRDDRGRTEMHRATCADCGKTCEVPFRPSAGKPVYCSDCFVKGSTNGPSKPDQSNKKFDEMNAKLDKILSLLQRMNLIEETVVIKEEKAPKKDTPKKVAKKVAPKKATPKKAAPKKVATKKPAKKKTK